MRTDKTFEELKALVAGPVTQDVAALEAAMVSTLEQIKLSTDIHHGLAHWWAEHVSPLKVGQVLEINEIARAPGFGYLSHHGKHIRIDRIEARIDRWSGEPEIHYVGTIVKKDGTVGSLTTEFTWRKQLGRK